MHGKVPRYVDMCGIFFVYCEYILCVIFGNSNQNDLSHAIKMRQKGIAANKCNETEMFVVK